MDSNKKKAIEALKKSLGIVTTACESIGLARSTFYDWINKDKDFKEAVDEINEEAIDLTESKLFERIKGYSHREDKIFCHEGIPVIVPTTKHYPPDVTAIIFYLKTKGKKRGYDQEADANTSKSIRVIFDE
jgi:hypothetical protein